MTNTCRKSRNSPERAAVRWVNLILLLLASAVSMATLKGEGGDNHGAASTEVEWLSWKNQHRQRLTVSIAPRSDRLDPLAHEGPIHLQVRLGPVSEHLAASPRWSASVMTTAGEVWSLDGGFPTFGGEVMAEDDGTRSGEVSAQVGRLCEAAETSEDGCIPCDVSVGCSLTVLVDFCYVVGDHTVRAEVSLTDSLGEPFALTCPDNTPSQPCTKLRDWMNAEGHPSEPGLCPGE